ncbi:MAG: type IV secretory system conjugative DNA transfer family protein [Chloroflexi bacterium]|nr:type IV secretory system conjugative DNA transfer family protein [Chloroflexota bacterium]
MITWLFTTGRELRTGLILPLLCLTPVLVLTAAALLGAGIRTTNDPVARRSPALRLLLILSHAAALLTVAALFLALLGDLAVQRGRSTGGWVDLLVGAPRGIDGRRLLTFAVMLAGLLILTAAGLHSLIRDGGWLRERIDRLRAPAIRRGALGSSHFCTPREYRRFRRLDPEGLILLGAFWGEDRRRLDFGAGRFCLSGEDVARGLLALGGPGSGKTQGVILPAIADRMLSGHSLIIADPQREIAGQLLAIAAVTRHLVVIHDPTSADGPRYNLAEGITGVSDARAIADVLVPTAQGDNRFWSDSAAALLAACLIRFDTLGAIYSAMNDLKGLAAALSAKHDDASLLANSFIASVGSDGKVAANVIATLATALAGWASVDVRANTAASDFDAGLIVQQPTVVVLTCPGRMRAVYASYLGATLRKLMLDLDSIGEARGGPLPMPVGVILDEFPTLGKLDSLVADVNLVRKRRISILIGAQTKGQFHLIYGHEGTQALFTGLATQVVYGGCDADTAEFYSMASGTATTDANADDPGSHLRQRPLLTIDEVISPQAGSCTVFARYVETGYAAQVILNARLTRFYEREDWRRRLADAAGRDPLLLERGISVELEPTATADAHHQRSPIAGGPSSIERAARAKLAEVNARAEQASGRRVALVTVEALRKRREERQQERSRERMP